MTRFSASRWCQSVGTRRLLPLAAVVSMSATLQGCGGCSENNIVSRQPVAVDEDDDSYDNDWGSWLSMSLDADGAPIVSYYDRTKGGLGFATASFDEDGAVRWRHEQVDGFSDESGLDVGDRGKYTSMAVSGDGTVWIAYQDIQNKTLRWARTDADAGWINGLADSGGGASPDAGHYASLALDSAGLPVIAHYDRAKGHLRVAHFDEASSSFTGEVVDEGEPTVDAEGEEVDADVGMFASMTIANGIEYIAYYDAANGDLKLAWGGTGNYTIETVATDGDVGQWPDVVVDNGTIYISHHDVGNQDLMFSSGEPGTWSTGPIDEGDHVGADSHLRIVNGVANIVYFDGRNNDMKRAIQTDGGWSMATVTTEPGALGFHNEVVVADGQTYAACYNYTARSLWFSQVN